MKIFAAIKGRGFALHNEACKSLGCKFDFFFFNRRFLKKEPTIGLAFLKTSELTGSISNISYPLAVTW